MEQNEGMNILWGVCCVLKEQKQWQELPFKSIYAPGNPRFPFSLLWLGLVCTDLIHFPVEERCIFHPDLQPTTLSSAGIFCFLIFLVVSFIILVDAFRWREKKNMEEGKILMSYQTRNL